MPAAINDGGVVTVIFPKTFFSQGQAVAARRRGIPFPCAPACGSLPHQSVVLTASPQGEAGCDPKPTVPVPQSLPPWGKGDRLRWMRGRESAANGKTAVSKMTEGWRLLSLPPSTFHPLPCAVRRAYRVFPCVDRCQMAATLRSYECYTSSKQAAPVGTACCIHFVYFLVRVKSSLRRST